MHLHQRPLFLFPARTLEINLTPAARCRRETSRRLRKKNLSGNSNHGSCGVSEKTRCPEWRHARRLLAITAPACFTCRPTNERLEARAHVVPGGGLGRSRLGGRRAARTRGATPRPARPTVAGPGGTGAIDRSSPPSGRPLHTGRRRDVSASFQARDHQKVTSRRLPFHPEGVETKTKKFGEK